MMQVADILGFLSRNYHWNSIKLCKVVRIMTSCPTPVCLESRTYASITENWCVQSNRSITN